MHIYEYTAIIAKNSVVKGNVTHTDRRSSAIFEVPLRSACIVDYVPAESPDQAKNNAIKEVKQRYPHEQGFRGHDNVRVGRTI